MFNSTLPFILRTPDADESVSGAGAEQKTRESSANQQDEKTPDLGKIRTKFHGDGVHEGRERVLGQLRRAIDGGDIPLNDDGSLNVEKYVELASKKKAAKPENESDDKSDNYIRKANERAIKAEAERDALAIQTQLTTAMPAKVADTEGVVAILERRYDFYLADGEVRVRAKGSKSPVRGDDGEILTVAQIVDKLLAEKPYLAKKEHRDAGGKPGNLTNAGNKSGPQSDAEKMQTARDLMTGKKTLADTR